MWLGMQTRHQARRFITLIDELYNHRTRLVCLADAPPDELFAGKSVTVSAICTR